MPAPSPDQVVGQAPPIQIHVYPPPPRGVRPRFPDALIDLVQQERFSEPNRQHLVCDTCGFAYTVLNMSGQRCTQRTKGPIQCTGTIQGQWSRENVRDWIEKVHKDPNAGLAIAWLQERPVAFMVTKRLREDVICRTFNWPIGALQQIKKWYPHGGTFLTVPAIWVLPDIERESVDPGKLFGRLMDALFTQITRGLECPMLPTLLPLGTERTDPRKKWFQAHVDEGGFQELSLGDPPSARRDRTLLAFEFHDETLFSRS